MSNIQITILFFFILNIYVTFRVWRKHEFNRFQKIGQNIIIWLIPILGAIGIWAFIHSDENPRGPYNPGDGQGTDGISGIS